MWKLIYEQIETSSTNSLLKLLTKYCCCCCKALNRKRSRPQPTATTTPSMPAIRSDSLAMGDPEGQRQDPTRVDLHRDRPVATVASEAEPDLESRGGVGADIRAGEQCSWTRTAAMPCPLIKLSQSIKHMHIPCGSCAHQRSHTHLPKVIPHPPTHPTPLRSHL